MHGSVRVGYDGSQKIAPEWNVKANLFDTVAVYLAFAQRPLISAVHSAGFVVK